MKAKVRWFDRRDGEGMATTETGNPVRILAAGIPGKKTWFSHTACVYYEDGQEIEVEYVDDYPPYYRCLTKGHFDENKWNNLDHDRLAFRCDENGDAINGLFK